MFKSLIGDTCFYPQGDMIMKTLTTAEAYVILLTQITNDFCKGMIDAEEY